MRAGFIIAVLNPTTGDDLIIDVFYQFFIVIIIVITLSIIMLVFHSLETPLHNSDAVEFVTNPRSFLARYLLFSPWFEELVFRLFLMDFYFVGMGLDLLIASVVSSMFFAGFHLFYVFEEKSSMKGLVIEFTFLFAGGMAMAVIYWTAGILVAIISHLVVNVVEVLSFSFAARKDRS